jgi:glycosyltransferase involved in cell wall biosynthesis
MLLSILICTIHQRKEQLHLLLTELEKQSIENGYKINSDLEIFIRDDWHENFNGLATINVGQKRDLLLKGSKGKIVCFIDDDDWISPNYLKLIIEAIKSNPNIDCIGFLQDYLVDGKEQIGGSKVCISLKYNQWDLNVDGYLAVRTPNHLTPIKRQICIDAGGYKNLEKAEDLDFSNRVYPFLKNEYFINETMYYYRKKTENEHQKF